MLAHLPHFSRRSCLQTWATSSRTPRPVCAPKIRISHLRMCENIFACARLQEYRSSTENRRRRIRFQIATVILPRKLYQITVT